MAFDDKVINGSDIVLSVEDKIIACATSHSVELTNAVREISCKGSGDFTSAEYGRFSWTVSTDALLNLGSGATYVSYADLMALMIAKTVVSIKSEYDQDGDAANTMILTGDCIITSISQSAPDSDNASYSVSLQGRGALTITTVEAS